MMLAIIDETALSDLTSTVDAATLAWPTKPPLQIAAYRRIAGDGTPARVLLEWTQ